MLSSIILALLSINICTASSQLQIRDPCDDQHALCIPEEAEDYETPSVRTGIKYLLVDLMSSVTSYAGARRDVKYGREPLVGRAPSDDLCCKSGFIHQLWRGNLATVLDWKCRPIWRQLLPSREPPGTVLLCKH